MSGSFLARRDIPELIRQPWFSAGILLLGASGASLLGPPEATLGEGVRLVYLHGAWVWSALLCLAGAAVCGLIGLFPENTVWNRWSVGFGRAGIALWASYLPISLLAMDMNWNGLFLSEPRWVLGINIAITGILLQVAILVIDRDRAAGLINALFFVAITALLSTTEQVLHPPSPIFNSASLSIRVFFLTLVLLCSLAGFQLARSLRSAAPDLN